MIKVPSLDTKENKVTSGALGNPNLLRERSAWIEQDDYIYLLRVEQADKNKRINTEAEFKNIST